MKGLDQTIGNEIKKGENASITEIKEMVKRLSSVETTAKSLERIDKRIGAFRFDFVSLGLITVMVVISTFAPQLDAAVIIVMALMGYFVFLDIYNFISNVQDFQEIKRKLRKGEI